MKRMIVIILSILLLSVDTAIAYPPVPLSMGAPAEDAVIEWEPPSVVLFDYVAIYITSDVTGLTSITFNMEHCRDGIEIYGVPDVVEISFPKLTEVAPTSGMYTSQLKLNNMPSLTTVDLPELTTVDGEFEITANPLLTTINLASLVPTSEGGFYFSENALTAESVNAILARFVANAEFVSGYIDLSGGTNAAPTGQGLTDVTTLRARGVTVSVNGE
jgi:hypothetical protein